MRIRLDNIQLKAYHGIYDVEREQGNSFSIDVAFDFDGELSATSDNIDDTINYEEIYRIVRNEMAITANLLENVAQRIYSKIKERFDNIYNIYVAVSKYNPFRDGNVDRVMVEVGDCVVV